MQVTLDLFVFDNQSFTKQRLCLSERILPCHTFKRSYRPNEVPFRGTHRVKVLKIKKE
jgi:hypothetical protein